MAVELSCEFPGCTASKSADNLSTALGLLKLHHEQVHVSGASEKQKAPKIDRPTIHQGCTEEDWAAFTRRWELFKAGTALHPSQVTPQLLACCEKDLESALFRDDPLVATKTPDTVLDSIKRLAVVGVALSARRAAALKTSQEPGEPIRQYVARLRGKAHACNFTTEGSCGLATCVADFTDDMVKMIMINGLADEEIKKDVLSCTDIDSKNLSDTIAVIDSKETAARAMLAAPSAVAASTYKKLSVPKKPNANGDVIKCADCDTQMPKITTIRGKPREFKVCRACWGRNRGSKPAEQALFHCLAAVGTVNHRVVMVQRRGRVAVRSPDQYIFKGPGLGWRKADALPHPTLRLYVATDPVAYSEFGVTAPAPVSARLEVVADSGAQVCLMGLNVMHRLGLKKKDLIPVQKGVQAANGEEINILGALLLKFTGYDNERPVSTSALTYVTTATERFYLNRESLKLLGIISEDFPKVNSTGSVIGAAISTPQVQSTTPPAQPTACPVPLVTVAQADPVSPKSPPRTSELAPCGCLLRSSPPPRPSELPFAPVPENTAKMRRWLVERYAASTFNQCPHQALPAMPGPPMEIMVDPDAKPVVTRRPVHVPLHWKEEVREQLERDVALGVIERVPPNTPVTWLHNMVITAKSDGSPRRTVDLQSLNRHCVRETHYCTPPGPTSSLHTRRPGEDCNGCVERVPFD